MKTYLVTGGAGFIGSHLVAHLLAQGHHVRVLDDLSTGKRENLPLDPACQLCIGDVSHRTMVRSAMQGVAGVFHLAAVASVPRSTEAWSESHRVNQTGTVNVLEAARAHRTPVVYASSAAIYGDNADTPLTEASIASPISAYGVDKYGSELHARVASTLHGVPTVGLRFFNVFGERQDPSSPYSGVISIFAHRILARSEITLYGDGEQTRDFIYVGDVAQMLYRAMQRADTTPRVFNACTGRSTSIKQLAETIMGLTGVKVAIHHAAHRSGDIRRSVGDPTQVRDFLDFSADPLLSVGLGRYLSSLEAGQGLNCRLALVG